MCKNADVQERIRKGVNMDNVCFLRMTNGTVVRIIDDGKVLKELSQVEIPTPCMLSAQSSAIGEQVKELLKGNVSGDFSKELAEAAFANKVWFAKETKILL